MPDLTPQQWGAVALAVAAVLYYGYQNFGAIKGMFPKISPAAKVSDDRLEALRSLDEVYGYFKSVKCEAGMEGVRKLVPHVYDEQHGGHS